MPYHVKAEWDAEADVRVAYSEDVPGLATGAGTIEGLIRKLRVVVPELLQENGLLAAGQQDIELEISAERTERVRYAA
jgi:hypothetical protein